MEYQKTVRADGTATLTRIFRQGDTVKTVPVGIEFESESEADKYYWAFEMVSSVWCYNGKQMDNRYLERHIAEIGSEPIEEEFDWLNEHCTTAYAGEDSEGVWYNTIRYKG